MCSNDSTQMMFGRVAVLTQLLSTINSVIKAKVDGISFEVHVLEDLSVDWIRNQSNIFEVNEIPSTFSSEKVRSSVFNQNVAVDTSLSAPHLNENKIHEEKFDDDGQDDVINGGFDGDSNDKDDVGINGKQCNSHNSERNGSTYDIGSSVTSDSLRRVPRYA